MREIVVDTETTGLDPASGHRLVEIACVELLNFVPTGQKFHAYLDPQRSMPEEAFRIHGLSSEFLAGKPLFEDVRDDFLSFILDSRLVIHNAEFDMKFINAELRQAGSKPLAMERVFDTLALARKKHPGASNSLDALCARYRIDNSKRTKHGALLDAEILSEVYTELMGGRQTKMSLQAAAPIVKDSSVTIKPGRVTQVESYLMESEIHAHRVFTQTMGEKALWANYFPDKPV